jgi:uncharacterized membrane protein YphA (DoxX/SURF4 family)
MRLQPQYYANVLLIFATINQSGLWLCRWLNVSMWIWAGVQKFLSPEWFGKASWDIVSRCGFDPEWYWYFALTVAITELAHGLFAVFKPRMAAWTCMAMHVGISIFLTPLFYNWNMSVIPWNLATAIIGFWTLRHFEDWRPGGRVQTALVSVFMLYPLLFFVGLMDHTFSGVLYSAHIPRGLMTTPDGPKEILGWGKLHVPFPSERRTFRIYFERASSPGDKLHIADPRRLLDDLYYIKTNDRYAVRISRERFFSQQDGEVMGIGRDTNDAIFALSRAGVRMLKRTPDSMIYAIEIPADRYDPKLLDLLAGIPNLEQLQLKNANVQDEDLARLPDLPQLIGIGLSGTQVTDEGLRQLARFRKLAIVEVENTTITADGLNSILVEREVAE